MKYVFMIFLFFPMTFCKAEFGIDKCTLALWHFNEGKGDTLYDSSGNGHHGRIFGAKWTEQGVFDGCLLFDGIDDFVEILGSDKLVPDKKLTLETWVKIDATAYRRFAIISKGDNYRSENGYLWEIQPDGRFKFYLNVTDWKVSKTMIPLNEWIYLAITFDGSKLRYYIDGEETDVFESRYKKIKGNDYNVIIGRTSNTNTYFFPGLIDEIRISSCARTAKEIEEHWSSVKKRDITQYIFYLKNGDRVSGEILEPTEILFETKYGDLQIPIVDISAIDLVMEQEGDVIFISGYSFAGTVKNEVFKLKTQFGKLEVNRTIINKISH